MNLVANRLQAVAPSPTLTLSAKVIEKQQAGHDIINLTVGEPDFPTPSWVAEAAVQALQKGQTKYTAVGGTPLLKEAVIQKFMRENNLTYSPSEIIVSAGGKQVIFNAMLATLNPGDEVIIPAPYWVSYPDMVHLAEGTARIIPCSQLQHFKLTPESLEEALNEKTRWLILNAPSNPTGMLYSYDELWQLAQVLRRYPKVLILSDDIYEHLVFDERPFNTIADVEPDLKERTLVVNGCSKSYAMTGLRLGYGAGPRWLIKAMTDIQSHSTSNPCSLSQAAAIAALTGPQSFLAEWRASFQERRDFMLAAMAALPGVSVLKPDGAFYLFPNVLGLLGKKTPVGDHLNTDLDLSTYLLEEAGVAVVPGSGFGAPGYLRLSYAVDMSLLEKAAERVRRAVEALKPAGEG